MVTLPTMVQNRQGKSRRRYAHGRKTAQLFSKRWRPFASTRRDLGDGQSPDHGSSM